MYFKLITKIAASPISKRNYINFYTREPIYIFYKLIYSTRIGKSRQSHYIYIYFCCVNYSIDNKDPTMPQKQFYSYDPVVFLEILCDFL